jgi:tyrosyl-tRNA synthetase
MTFLEFNYMILQAYDFLELAQRNGCRLQMGGSDQWGNIVNGIELSRRMDALELLWPDSPLLATADGAKMGKTAKGAVWLNPNCLPTITGSSGAIRRMPMSVASCDCSPTLILRKSAGSKGLQERK